MTKYTADSIFMLESINILLKNLVKQYVYTQYLSYARPYESKNNKCKRSINNILVNCFCCFMDNQIDPLQCGAL